MAKKLDYSRYNKNSLKGQTFYYVDKYGLVLNSVGQGGRGDCIGRTYRAYMTTRDPMLAKSVSKLWNYTEGISEGRIKGIRHPELADIDRKMSRDHYINTLALLKAAIDDNADGEERSMIRDKFDIITKTPSRKIDHMMRFTLPLKFWTKALRGSKIHEWLFYATEIITAVFVYLPVTKLGNLIAGFSTEEVDQDDWEDYEPKHIQEQKKWKSIVNKIIYPAFARGFLMTQVYSLDNNFPKMRNILFRVHRPLVGSTNYVQKLQLGMKVPQDKVEWYQPMSGGRWTGWLNNRNDRWIIKLNMEKPTQNKVRKSSRLMDVVKEVDSGYKYQNLFSVDWLRYWWNMNA